MFSLFNQLRSNVPAALCILLSTLLAIMIELKLFRWCFHFVHFLRFDLLLAIHLSFLFFKVVLFVFVSWILVRTLWHFYSNFFQHIFRLLWIYPVSFSFIIVFVLWIVFRNSRLRRKGFGLLSTTRLRWTMIGGVKDIVSTDSPSNLK